jgi:AmmeMemoRadiSam system protein A
VTEQKLLLDLARSTLKEVVLKGRLPKPDPDTFPKSLHEPKGCFVTLTKEGALRGCIGHIFPQKPLYVAVMENARSAATRDSRFNPLQPEELDFIEVEISVLTIPQPLAFSSPEELLGKLTPHKDGVVLTVGGRAATYLPQVWEQVRDKVEFLSSLAQKAGQSASAWRNPGTTVMLYQVEAFKENDV